MSITRPVLQPSSSQPTAASKEPARGSTEPSIGPSLLRATDLVGGPAPSLETTVLQDEIASYVRALVPPAQDKPEDAEARVSGHDRTLLKNALAALMAAQRAGAQGDVLPSVVNAFDFSALLSTWFLSLTGQPLLGSLPGDSLEWPEGLNPGAYGLGVFDCERDPKLILKALSLANPPLKIPIVVITKGDAATLEARTSRGLAERQVLHVAGTYRDGEGVAHLLLARGDAFAVFERHLSVPLSLLSEILSHIIVGDARVEQALRNSEQDYAKLPADRACCRHVAASAGVKEAPRTREAGLLTGGEKCLLCPYAHALCAPGSSKA